jgi:extracellular elastinolytic metalloproteinase
MRLSSKTSLALVGLLASALAHDGPISRRKTMGFGPVHPHAKFHTNPISSLKASFANSDPYEVARSFVTTLLEDQLSGDNSFALRKDSYTDKATGVTHVFFRQMINGIEVADGDINVNVKDGAVISYGDSVRVVLGASPSAGGANFITPVLSWQCTWYLPH